MIILQHVFFLTFFCFLKHWFYTSFVVALQSVEEAECRRAYDSATEVYMSSFERSTAPEEVSNLFYLLKVNNDYSCSF